MTITNMLKAVLIGLLVFVALPELPGQIRHKQLRKEVLESQQPAGKPSRRERVTPKPIPVPAPVAPIRTPYEQPNARIIVMENADLLSVDQLMRPDLQLASGNVRFRHDNATMTCDSAHVFMVSNSFVAFSRIVINQGDTLFAYGDKLYYDGNTKLARLRGNVRLENRKTVLTTDSLNYDRISQLAYYFTGGKIVDPENTLTSVWGQYSTSTDDALFSKEVKLVNENFTMTSDTLEYNTRTHVSNMVGTTHIVYKNDTEIFTDKGWYNTDTERSMLLNRSKVINKEGKELVADTIFYDKRLGYGESFGKVVMNDTVQKSTLYGNYVYYKEETELGIATDSALLVDWSDIAKPMYIHADTLQTYKQDTLYNHAKAWFNVRFYRDDIQGLSDSLFYDGRDSVLTLYRDPVLWQENQQLSADEVRVYTANKKVNKVHLEENSMVVEMVDSVHFNQMVGKEIIAYVDSGHIRLVEVNGNAETVYYAREENDSLLLGANKTESSKVVIHFKDKKIDRVVLTSASSGVFYPLHIVTEEKTRLEQFFWAENRRPMSKEEVFYRFPAGERPKIAFRTPPPNKEEPLEKTDGNTTGEAMETPSSELD
ncbi:MAG: hypothetical protein BGP01_13115 [Paludibacter sp. 47-17]|nr:MAG: hypothetical protein BGP01_13115 [Paludibacter sp. 47-17]